MAPLLKLNYYMFIIKNNPTSRGGLIMLKKLLEVRYAKTKDKTILEKISEINSKINLCKTKSAFPVRYVK